jgi:hypothetical protein
MHFIGQSFFPRKESCVYMALLLSHLQMHSEQNEVVHLEHYLGSFTACRQMMHFIWALIRAACLSGASSPLGENSIPVGFGSRFLPGENIVLVRYCSRFLNYYSGFETLLN